VVRAQADSSQSESIQTARNSILILMDMFQGLGGKSTIGPGIRMPGTAQAAQQRNSHAARALLGFLSENQ
jgi:hypothetical protein